MRKLSLTVGAFLLLMTGESQAHIKWFCAYDTTVPPLPISEVITPTFAAVAILFCTLMFTAYVIDRVVNASAWAKRLDDAIFRCQSYSSIIIRVAVGILFLVLWESGGIILTPELKTTSILVPWLQLAIAGSMLFRSTLKFGAVGIMVLYVYAVVAYGGVPPDGLSCLPRRCRLSLADECEEPFPERSPIAGTLHQRGGHHDVGGDREIRLSLLDIPAPGDPCGSYRRV